MKLRTIGTLGLICLSGIVNAWIDAGHMVVALIAHDRLNHKVQLEVDRLIKIGGTNKTRDFVTASCWADDTKTRTTGPWHYVDFHFRSDGQPTSNKPDAENVLWAIEKFKAILADRSKPDEERADALRYLIHLVGDIHQPLHATARDSDENPDGDAGGNRFHLVAPSIYKNLPRPPSNLHALWDFGAGVFVPIKRPISVEGNKQLKTWATSITKAFPFKKLPEASDAKPMDWALESWEIAKKDVYSTPENAEPSPKYLATSQIIAKRRIALAGYRLANLLNETLK